MLIAIGVIVYFLGATEFGVKVLELVIALRLLRILVLLQ